MDINKLTICMLSSGDSGIGDDFVTVPGGSSGTEGDSGEGISLEMRSGEGREDVAFLVGGAIGEAGVACWIEDSTLCDEMLDGPAGALNSWPGD